MGIWEGVWPCRERGSKARFREEMTTTMGEWDIPWFLGGYFNTIQYLEEREGCRVISSAMEEFSKFINDHVLIHLPLTGASFTWSRSRLDKFLVSTTWEEMAPNLIQIPLPRLTSDHSPIMLYIWRGRNMRAPF